MGIMNLLKANWTGKVGNTVGARWKDKNTIRTAVEGKAPATPSQTNALLAFGSLQRVIRQIQIVIQPTIYHPCPKMTEQNAWVHYSKAAVAGGMFNPAGILGPKGKLETFRDVILTYNPTTGVIHGERNLPAGYSDTGNQVVWVTFWDGETMLYPLVAQQHPSRNYTFSIGANRLGPIWAMSMWQIPGYRTKLYSQLVATVAAIVTDRSEIGPQPAVEDITAPDFGAEEQIQKKRKVRTKSKKKVEEKEKPIAKESEV